MTFITRSAALVAVSALSACGGGATGKSASAPTATQFASIVSADQATIARIAGNNKGATGITPTPAASVPTTGSATYKGVGVVGITVTSSRDVLMRGDATVNANFASGALSGSIKDIVAVDEINSRPVLVDNNIALTGGRINSSARDTFSLNYSGDLDVGGTNYDLNGTMAGQFRGTNAAALSATANNQTTVSGGSNLVTTIGVVGEQ